MFGARRFAFRAIDICRNPAFWGAGTAARLCEPRRRRSRPRAHVSSRGRELGETTRADRKTRSARRCHSALARILESLAVALGTTDRSEDHTSELQSLMRTSYAVFC